MPREQDQHSVIWPQDLQDDPMSAAVGDDDFSKFLDLDSDFQFAGLDNGQSGLDTPMGRLGFGQGGPHTMQSLSFQQQQQLINMELSLNASQQGYSSQIPTTQNFEPFQQYHHMQMGHQYHVPPTPVSSEMHAAKYAQQMDNGGHLIFDRQQASFTPLVSPAQTPMTGGFTLPEFGNADDFFSPLTSPAIEAQMAQSLTGTTASPVDTTDTAKPTGPARRGRRKGSVSTRTPARSVKQSPATRPVTRRKGTSLGNLSSDRIDTAIQRVNQTLQPPLGPGTARSSDDSVSPEPLSEALMGPPPVPQSAEKPSQPQQSQSSTSGNAVTPATLMMIPRKERGTPSSAELRQQPIASSEPMEDISLPDAAAPPSRPTGLRIDVDGHNDEEHGTPTLSAKSAKLSATSTPRGASLKSPSDSLGQTPRPENRGGGRGNKKRQSTTTAAISPALRPKISPSITPLAPASAPGMPLHSAETNALYLASKSNYQNIIDGTHLPGVSYPEALAENLSSKRTSHKIAEQGRRNRINLALKEIEGLLPPSISGNGGKKDRSSTTPEHDAGAPALQGASKASTVEMAIVYIRSLQAELKVTKDKLDTAEKKLADHSSSSAESQASE